MTTSAEATSQAQPTNDTKSTQATEDAGSRSEQARRLVRRNAYWALGLGLIPIPVVDFLALTGVQVKMLKELSDLYQVKFFEDKAKTIIGSLVTGLGSLSLTAMVARSFFKIVPGIGQIIGTVGASVFGGAFTLAVGNLFTMHYESGGTLLNFDADKMRAHFRQEFAKAKESVRNIQAEKGAGSGDSVAP